MSDKQQSTRDMSQEGFPVGTTEFAKGSPATDDWHDSVLAEIVDMGMSFEYSKKGDHRGALVFQLDETYDDGDFAGQRKECVHYFSFDRGLGSSAKGTELRRILEGWRGSEFTLAEMEKMKVEPFKLAKLIGLPLMILTVAKKAEKSDRMYSEIVKTAVPNKDKSKRLKVSENYVPWHEREGRKQKPQDARGNAAEPEGAFGGGGGAAAEDDDEPPF